MLSFNSEVEKTTSKLIFRCVRIVSLETHGLFIGIFTCFVKLLEQHHNLHEKLYNKQQVCIMTFPPLQISLGGIRGGIKSNQRGIVCLLK